MPQKKENYILHTNVYIYLVCIHIYMYTYIYKYKYNIYIHTRMYIYIFRLWLRHDLMFLPATAAKIYQPFTKQSSPNAFFGGRNLTSSITWIFLNHLKSKFCMVESLFYLEISPTTLGTKKQKNSWLDCSCIGIQTSTSVTWTVKELQAGAPAPVGGVINLINWYNYNKP